ncbi:unnamed protein product, partial [Allacma fusca]
LIDLMLLHLRNGVPQSVSLTPGQNLID